MAANIWQMPAGGGLGQIYLWAQNLIRLFQQGKHKDRDIVSVTLTAGTSSVVTATGVTDDCAITLTPTSSAAAGLSPYVSAKSQGVSFTLTHGTAAGTETYDCVILR